MPKLKCSCGSKNFVSGLVKLAFIGIPCKIDMDEGPEYNEMLARYSFGWDTIEYDEIRCKECEKDYILGRDDEDRMILFDK